MTKTSARTETHKRTMLSIDVEEQCRRQVRIEALQRGLTMREYVQTILDHRHDLVGKLTK